MGEREDDDESGRQTRGLAALALLLAIAVIALYLFVHLHREGEIENCLMAGRTNCGALTEGR